LDGYEILRLGYGESVLLCKGPPFSLPLVVRDDAGEVTEVDSAELDVPLAGIRAHADGFRALDLVGDRDIPYQAYLYHINHDGSVEMLGEYLDIPEIADLRGGCAIERGDAFLCMARDRDLLFNDLIVRGELGANAEIVYDQATGPLTKIRGSYLVTGP
jgi:hypothetical protein